MRGGRMGPEGRVTWNGSGDKSESGDTERERVRSL